MKVVNVATNDALMEMKDQMKSEIANQLKTEIGALKDKLENHMMTSNETMAQILAKLNENSN